MLTLFLSVICLAQSSYEYRQPKDLNDSWETSSLEFQNIDTSLVYKLFNQIKVEQSKLHSVLLVM